MNTEKTISKIDTKCIELFKHFITTTSDVNTILTVLTHIYINYTRMLIRDANNLDIYTDKEIYFLSELIEIFECGDENRL